MTSRRCRRDAGPRQFSELWADRAIPAREFYQSYVRPGRAYGGDTTAGRQSHRGVRLRDSQFSAGRRLATSCSTLAVWRFRSGRPPPRSRGSSSIMVRVMRKGEATPCLVANTRTAGGPDVVAGDEIRRRGGKEDTGPRQVFRLAQTARRRLIDDVCGALGVLPDGIGHLGADPPGRNEIQLDVVACPVERHGPRQVPHTRFAGGVGRVACGAPQGVSGTEVDDLAAAGLHQLRVDGLTE